MAWCDCGGVEGNTSGSGCLRNYRNQYCHDELRRGPVMRCLAQQRHGRPPAAKQTGLASPPRASVGSLVGSCSPRAPAAPRGGSARSRKTCQRGTKASHPASFEITGLVLPKTSNVAPRLASEVAAKVDVSRRMSFASPIRWIARAAAIAWRRADDAFAMTWLQLTSSSPRLR